MPVTKDTPSMHHPRRRNVTTSMNGLKMVTYSQNSPKMVNPRDIAGERSSSRTTPVFSRGPFSKVESYH